jgi:hypothetical protein
MWRGMGEEKEEGDEEEYGRISVKMEGCAGA